MFAPIAFLLAAPAAEPLPLPPAERDRETVVVTAARVDRPRASTAATVARINEATIRALGTPMLADLVRLTPSAAVNANGPAGSFTQVRLRGAEANHTLLIVDGIKANDLAYADEPRFELVNADIASNVEIVRGPQSALWGSQAIGGVVSLVALDRGAKVARLDGEVGSFGFRRTALAVADGGARTHVSGAIALQRARGIDVSGGGADRDGYRNLAGRAGLSHAIAPSVTVGLNGFALSGRSDYDGDDPYTFAKSEALSVSSRLAAGRLWARLGAAGSPWQASLFASRFKSRNRNLFEGAETNRARGTRDTLGGQVERRFSRHTLVLAAEREGERYSARDTIYGGFSNQDSRRTHSSITGEWIADWTLLTSDVSLRHERFSGFGDATTVRASVLVPLAPRIALAAGYGEGFAPPTFTEIYGFFPGSFVGNPGLRPEKSRGFEGALRYRSARIDAEIGLFSQRLSDEIVTLFNPDFTSSAANRAETSGRRGVEVEATWRPRADTTFSGHYAFLDADEPSASGPVREVRRPRHSGAIVATTTRGALRLGGSFAYVGARRDSDFATFPALPVRLEPYWLASAQAGWRVGRRVELTLRGSNLFDADYQDTFGYRTEGRGLFVGIRLADPRSSR